MLNFFDTIVDYIQLVWQFFLNMITSLLNLFTAVSGAAQLPAIIIGYVFAPLGACMMAVVGFAVVKIIVGRSSV